MLGDFLWFLRHGIGNKKSLQPTPPVRLSGWDRSQLLLYFELGLED
jgi:hypothetical protein